MGWELLNIASEAFAHLLPCGRGFCYGTARVSKRRFANTSDALFKLTQARFKGENRTYTEKADFSNCFNLFASNSCSRRFFVIAMARWISSRASESLPIFISRSPRTLGKRW